MRLRPGLVALFIIIVVLAGVAAYFITTPDATDAFRATKTIKDEKTVNKMVLGWVGAPYTSDYGVMRVPGYVDNNSKSKIKSVKLTIQLLDGDGNKKEKISYTLVKLQPESRKTFDINASTVRDSRKATIKIDEVVVYK